jgi:hypothetical protein
VTALQLRAQPETATVRGTVTDSNGAPVAGVTVSITAADSELDAIRSVTGGGGTYVAPFLKPGVYKVSVSQRGYQTFVVEGVRLDAGDVRTVDPKVAAGEPEDAQATPSSN